jgi:hypothetical protein
LNEAIAATASASPDPTYPVIHAELLAGSVSVLTTLVVIVAVSVVKPWGRTLRAGATTAAQPLPSHRGSVDRSGIGVPRHVNRDVTRPSDALPEGRRATTVMRSGAAGRQRLSYPGGSL